MQDGIERSLGRLEGRLEAINIDILAIKTWEIAHEKGHHGFHGRGPVGIWNRQNIQTGGITTIVVGIIEAIKSLLG